MGTPGGESEVNQGKGYRRVLGWAFGLTLILGLVAFIHLSIGWGALVDPWTEIQPLSLAGAVILLLGSYAVRTIRIQDYFRPATSGRFLRAFRLVLLHNLLNNLLPMRSGEASFPVLMRSGFRVPFKRSIPALVFLRVLDLHFVVLLGLAVFFWSRLGLVLILVLLVAPFPFLLWRTQKWLEGKFQGGKGRLASLGREVIQGLPSSPGLFWRTWFWTGANWSVKLLVLGWILQAFSPMPFSSALVGSTTGELSSVLPFHGVAGAGTYEAGVLAGLVPLGIEMGTAFKGAVNLHLFILGVSILAGTLASLVTVQGTSADESTDDS